MRYRMTRLPRIAACAAMERATSNALKPQQPVLAYKAFKSYEPDYFHLDVKYLPQMHVESKQLMNSTVD